MNQLMQNAVDEFTLSRHQLFAKTGILVNVKALKVIFHDDTLQFRVKN